MGRFGRPRPRTTCAACSTPPLWRAGACASSAPGPAGTPSPPTDYLPAPAPARRRRGGGRGDRRLLRGVDEIVGACPVPLPAWLAASGGKGIRLIPVAQGEAQLRTRWGKDGARVILDTCGVKAGLPGITDTATLKM